MVLSQLHALQGLADGLAALKTDDELSNPGDGMSGDDAAQTLSDFILQARALSSRRP